MTALPARALAALGGALLAALVAVVMTAVVSRYLFGAGLVWSEELAIWLHVALIAVGMPLAATGALAMRLDVLVGLLPARLRGVADCLADAVALHAALVIAFGGAQVALLVGGTSTVLALPEWLRFAAFACGGGLTLLFLLARAARGRSLAGAVLSLALGALLYWLARQSFEVALPASLVAGLAAAAGLALGAPLPFALISGVSLAGAFGGLLPEPAIVQNAVAGVSKFLLLAIPFFLLAGELLTTGRLAERLIAFAASLVGHWRAGLAQIGRAHV